MLAKALNKRFGLKIPEEFRYGKEQIADPSLTPPPLMDGGPAIAKPTMPPIPTAVTKPKPPIPVVETPVNAELQKVLEKQTQEIERLMTKVNELGKEKAAPQPQSQPQIQANVEPRKEGPSTGPKRPEPIMNTSSFGDDEDSITDFQDIGSMEVGQIKTPILKEDVPVATSVEQLTGVETFCNRGCKGQGQRNKCH